MPDSFDMTGQKSTTPAVDHSEFIQNILMMKVCVEKLMIILLQFDEDSVSTLLRLMFPLIYLSPSQVPQCFYNPYSANNSYTSNKYSECKY